MGNLVPSSRWDDVPYFEANAVLTGGPDCPDNLPIQALLNRTEYLKGMVENMSLGFDAVPETNKGLFIVVKQPHMRMMMWNGSQYVRAPWHQPCELFFSYDDPASIPGALPVRADVSYQQSNYPDVVARLGLSGTGTFTLIEARGEFVRVLDNGRRIDVGRANRSAQSDQLQLHMHNLPTGWSGDDPSVKWGIPDQYWERLVEGVNIGPSEMYPDEAASTFRDGAMGNFGGETRPRNVAFPLWMTI